MSNGIVGNCPFKRFVWVDNPASHDVKHATHLHVSAQLAVQKLVEIEFGDEGQNCQITITTNFPCYLYGTARAGS